MRIPQKLADEICIRIEFEEKLINAFNLGKMGLSDEAFKVQVKEYLDKLFSGLDVK